MLLQVLLQPCFLTEPLATLITPKQRRLPVILPDVHLELFLVPPRNQPELGVTNRTSQSSSLHDVINHFLLVPAILELITQTSRIFSGFRRPPILPIQLLQQVLPQLQH